MIFKRQYSYLLLFSFISSYLFLFTLADNNTTTDHHSNETIVEYNSTIFSPTTVANVSNEDDSILEAETKNSTAIPVETTDVSSPQTNVTFNEENNSTTMAMEKVEETTAMVANASCESAKYGCCADGITARTGKYFYGSFIDLYFFWSRSE